MLHSLSHHTKCRTQVASVERMSAREYLPLIATFPLQTGKTYQDFQKLLLASQQ